MSHVLILYYSRNGTTKKLAQQIAMGVDSKGLESRILTVPSAHGNNEDDTELCQLKDLQECDALALGSPTRFGHMAGAMQQFWETTTPLWIKGDLVDKPAAVFTSSSSLHGGQESTLLSMALPLLHHGMLLTGLPYCEPDLHDTKSGGSPYGASHVVQSEIADKLTNEEKRLAFQLGVRLANLCLKIKE